MSEHRKEFWKKQLSDLISAQSLNYVQLFVTPWTVACQAPPLSMGFSRQEYWSGLPFPSAGKWRLQCKKNLAIPDPDLNYISPIWLNRAALGILVPHPQGLNPCPLQWKHGVLSTRPPVNLLNYIFKTVRLYKNNFSRR